MLYTCLQSHILALLNLPDLLAPVNHLCMKNHTDLNNYHRQQSARLAKKVCEQPSMSPEASMNQIKRLNGKSQRPKVNAGK